MFSTNHRHTQKRFRTNARRALIASAALLVAVVASNCTSDDTQRDPVGNTGKQPSVTVTQQRGPQQQQQAAATPQTSGGYELLPPEVMNAEIRGVDGKSFKLSDTKKVVVLDLWATWCGPCRLEIPHLVEMSKEYEDKNVEVVGLTTENPDSDADKVREFAEEYKINYKLGWAHRELAVALMKGNYSIPQTFVIAPGGRLIARFRGYSDKLPAMIRGAIDRASEAPAVGD